jgi:hypothetical protein
MTLSTVPKRPTAPKKMVPPPPREGDVGHPRKRSKLVALTAMVFATLAGANGIEPDVLVRSLTEIPGTEELLKTVQRFNRNRKRPYQIHDLADRLVQKAYEDEDTRRGLEILLLRTAAVTSLNPQSPESKSFTKGLLEELWETVETPSALRIVAEQISAGGSIAIAGHNATIINIGGVPEKEALKTYLEDLRFTWDHPELSRISVAVEQNTETKMRLHQIYTPMDVWRQTSFQGVKPDELMFQRFRAIDRDVQDYRRPVLEALAKEPLIVLTGDAGTGKSSLARFAAIALSYACDPEAEKRDKLDGLKMLGVSWIHGPLLPLYVPLGEFAASDNFPKENKANASALLTYLKAQLGEFGKVVQKYLMAKAQPDKPYHSLLILDGLDEVYQQNHRVVIKKVVEDWANRYPTCRILLTSRTYAYRQSSRWYLSNRFVAAELAPYSRNQMKTYITNWYRNAAEIRPYSFGGKVAAKTNTKRLAEDMTRHIDNNHNTLIPMMRQPLLMALLTLIHETKKELPDKKAELYEAAIQLLYYWRPISDDQRFRSKLDRMDRSRLLNALQLAAFELQVRRPTYQNYPGVIERSTLKKYLLQQNKQGDGLGCDIDDLLSYLSSRNGILLPVLVDAYRFPHLTIQEYLAACALLELYDECPMPQHLKPPDGKRWKFPDNMVELLRDDPYRWRHVSLMVGAVVANNKGQDGRWALVEELLPRRLTTPPKEEDVFRVYIAAEIWAMNWLKARLPSHDFVRERLKVRVEAIKDSHHLDVPERMRIGEILGLFKAQKI